MASYSSSPAFTTGATLTKPVANTGKRGDVSAVSIGTIATVLTPTSGKKLRILGGYIGLSANASVLFEDNAAGTTVFRTPLIAANTPFHFDLGDGVLLGAVDNVLKATSSAAAAITGTIFYSEED